MSIYVDSILPCLPNKNWKYKYSCHLIADSIAELHAFAACLGLKRSWYQAFKAIPHYDLTINKRREAVKIGAISINRIQFTVLVKKYRRTMK
jgi:hypothetical protein